MSATKRRRWKIVLVSVASLAAAMQIVPYGHDRSNPRVIAEPSWDSPETRALARRACFDCHSNETTWPAYARVAPASWLVYYDVVKGREELNFSEWQRPQKEAHEAAEKVRDNEMPPPPYRLMHSSARLSSEERAALARGLAKTLGEETAHTRRAH